MYQFQEYYYVFQKLSWEGITNQVISTSNEFTILVSESEVDSFNNQ